MFRPREVGIAAYKQKKQEKSFAMAAGYWFGADSESTLHSFFQYFIDSENFLAKIQ